LLALLADGECHSGSSLAKSLRVSRSAIWKLVGALRELGIPVESLPRLGYRLPRAVDLLDGREIEKLLRDKVPIESFEAPLTVPSTNQHLIEVEAPQPGAMRVCTTELQSAGRGRRGRTWTAPFGSGVCFSLSWQFTEPPPDFAALGLVVGIAVVRSLVQLGFADVQIKWPNDIVWRHRKLGGILIEMRGEAGGPAKVVIGIGLNVRMPAAVRLELAKQNAVLLTDLHEVASAHLPTRNVLIATVLAELAGVLPIFALQGLAPFRDEWARFDALAHCAVKVFTQAETVSGEARGISAGGALLVDVNGRVQEFVSGEVSVRTTLPSMGKGM
jgi:BirA family biotin operon repressor/biotin-[acetyl-CoA-carboxylase] ligase